MGGIGVAHINAPAWGRDVRIIAGQNNVSADGERSTAVGRPSVSVHITTPMIGLQPMLLLMLLLVGLLGNSAQWLGRQIQGLLLGYRLL